MESELESSILENLHLPRCLFRNCRENIDSLFTEIGISDRALAKRGSKYCLARWCNNSKRVHPDLALFRLPIRRDKERALAWLTNADRDDLKLKSTQYLHSKYLCAVHFTDTMFMNAARKRLVWNAVPEVFAVPENAAHFSRLGSTDEAEQVGASEIPIQPDDVILANEVDRYDADDVFAETSPRPKRASGVDEGSCSWDSLLGTDDVDLWNDIFGPPDGNALPDVDFAELMTALRADD